jgi:hypothetical protein
MRAVRILLRLFPLAAAAGCVRPVVPAAPPVDPLGGCGVTDLPPARVWRLTRVQLRNTLQDLFGFSAVAVEALPAESRLEGYANNASAMGVPPLLMDHFNTISEEMAAGVLRNLRDPAAGSGRGGQARGGQLLPCALADLGRGSCLRDFVTRFGRRVWRRSLDAGEITRLTGVYSAAAEATDPGNGLRILLKALLLSPNFLFRSELGGAPEPAGYVQLGDFELAASLSYLLWDSTPDETLLELAAAGRLRDPEVRRLQARRMLASSRRSAPTFAAFIQQWLKIEDLLRIRKDRKQFPMYRDLAGDLLEENRRFVDSVAFDPGGDRRLRTLLTAPYTFVNTRTAAIYGVPAVEGGGLRAAKLDPSERRGILTQGAFLAAHAGSDTPNLVARGSFVREQVLCGEVPPPPDDFEFDEAKITDDMTAREKFTLHTTNPFCSRCHALFDGIGFALEAYDAIGRFRRTDRDKPIDPSGTLKLPGRADLPFANFVELVERLADLPETSSCFSLQYLSYASGRRPAEVSACEAKTLARSFAASGQRLDELVLAVAAAPGFALRRP